MFSMKLLSMVAGFGLMLGFASVSARAEDAATPKKETATISGTVVDKDGKAVSGATVDIIDAAKLQGMRKPAQQAAGDEKPKRPEPTATTTTDTDGKYTLADVPAGKYMIMAHLKGAGVARQRVTVVAGEDQTVALTMAAPGEKGEKGGKKKEPAAN